MTGGARARCARPPRGLKQGEFELYYQPLINLDDGHLVGFEALMRWNRPAHGLVPPDAFIPVAETTTLICDLGRWALQTAARQMAIWSRPGPDVDTSLRVAVNVSARHAAAPAIVTDVQAALSTSGIAPSSSNWNSPKRPCSTAQRSARSSPACAASA